MLDPGRFTYAEGEPNLRHWFRGTAAHNTVTVDGADQTPYARSRSSLPERRGDFLGRDDRDGLDILCGEVRSPVYEAVHRRRVIFVDGAYWLIEDAPDRRRAATATTCACTSRPRRTSDACDGCTIEGARSLALEDGWISPRVRRPHAGAGRERGRDRRARALRHAARAPDTRVLGSTATSPASASDTIVLARAGDAAMLAPTPPSPAATRCCAPRRWPASSPSACSTACRSSAASASTSSTASARACASSTATTATYVAARAPASATASPPPRSAPRSIPSPTTASWTWRRSAALLERCRQSTPRLVALGRRAVRDLRVPRPVGTRGRLRQGAARRRRTPRLRGLRRRRASASPAGARGRRATSLLLEAAGGRPPRPDGAGQRRCTRLGARWRRCTRRSARPPRFARGSTPRGSSPPRR